MNWFKRGPKPKTIQQQGGPNQHQTKSDWQRPIVEAIAGISNEIKSSTKENEKEDHARARRDNITIGLVFATFIAALVGDIIFFVTLQDARHAAKIQHNDTQAAAIEDGRAWIGPTQASISGTINTGQTITEKVWYQNFGKEPATNVSIIYSNSSVPVEKFYSNAHDGGVFRIDIFRDECKTYSPNPDSLVVFPSTNGTSSNFSMTVAESYFGHGGGEPISFAKIASGEYTLIVNVCFVYETFGQPKHTAFCFFYNAKISDPNSLNFCGGAYAD